jgi:transcriptional regulator with XRE-family HTH domain
MNKEIFIQRFLFLKEQKKLSLHKIANILDISTPSVQRFSTGVTKPSTDNLIKLADIFDVSLDYLVGRTDNPDVNK